MPAPAACLDTRPQPGLARAPVDIDAPEVSPCRSSQCSGSSTASHMGQSDPFTRFEVVLEAVEART